MIGGDWTLACVGLPAILVRHEDLVRFGDSKVASECPTCGQGFLPVRRDEKTFKLLDEDFCVVCGQMFVYIDPPWGRNWRDRQYDS